MRRAFAYPRHPLWIALVQSTLALGCNSGPAPLPSGIATKLALVTAPSQGQSGVPLAPPPVVEVQDGQGNAVAEPGRTVTAVLVTAGGTLSGTLQANTDPSGRASFGNLVVTGPAGSWQLRFDSPGLRSIAANPLQLSAGLAAGLAPFSGDFQTSVGGMPVPEPPRVRATDGAGNPVAGVPVSFAADNGGSVQGAAAVTDAAGLAAPAGWTLGTTLGLNTLTATSSALPGISVHFTATGTVGPPAALTVVAGDGQLGTPGGTVEIHPAVRVTDAFGRPLPGVAVTFSVTAGGGTVTPNVPLTDASGVATLLSWVLGLPPGVNTLTASRPGLTPVTITATGIDFQINAISGGSVHSCGLRTDGAPFCWGDNQFAQLGVTGIAVSFVPLLVSGGHLFSSIGVGTGYSCGIKANAQAFCWGNNSSGQLGDGTNTTRITPTPVAGGHSFSVIRPSVGFTCGLLQNGQAMCWGSNGNGQLGDGTNLGKLLPTAVAGARSYTALSTGTNHACAVEVGGAVYCWGSNGNGRLGDGTQFSQNTPTLVNSPLSFSAVAAGGSHTCAITTAGEGYCWGAGANGRLGNGAFIDQVLPAGVSGGLVLASVWAGTGHTCGLTTSGQLWCWGVNQFGQLGDGTTVAKAVPVQVAGGLTWSLVVAGPDHSCGRSTAGGAYCWGRNDSAQLGDGSIQPTRLTPVGVVKP